MASFNNSQPIYMQIIEQLYKQICNGELLPGDKLPSVRETAVKVGVNPNTVQRAYMEMERGGIVEARRGQGSFVTEDSNVLKELRLTMAGEQMNQFVTNMFELGFDADEIVVQVVQVIQNMNKEE